MPADVAALQDAVDQQVGLVVAERLAQHRLARTRRCRAPACSASPAIVGETCPARSSTPLARHRSSCLAMVSPRRCTSFGARCLKTSAASSSPSDISRMAASSRPWSSMVRASCAWRVRPALRRRPSRARCWPRRPGSAWRQARALVQLLVRRAAPSSAGGVLRRRQRGGVVVVGHHASSCPPAGLAARRHARRLQRRAHQAEHHQQRHQGQRQRRRGCAQQVEQPGLLPQRQSLRPSAAARRGTAR